MHLDSGKKTRSAEIYRITIIGSVVNLLLVVVKFAAGILGRSSAMIADAVHSLSDFVTDMVVIIFVKLSSKPKDKGHDYGHGKYETMATAIVGLVLMVVGVGIFYEGGAKIIDALRGEKLEEPAMIAFYAAVISIILKESLYWATVAVGKRVNSQVVIANAWHHRSDSFSSLGTAIGIGGAIFLGDKWRVLDPIAAVVVSIFIVKVAIELTLPAIADLLERSLPDEVESEIVKIVTSTNGVTDPHNLRTRRIGNDYAIEIHIRVDGATSVLDAHKMTRDIEQNIKNKYGMNTHVIVHVEPIK